MIWVTTLDKLGSIFEVDFGLLFSSQFSNSTFEAGGPVRAGAGSLPVPFSRPWQPHETEILS